MFIRFSKITRSTFVMYSSVLVLFIAGCQIQASCCLNPPPLLRQSANTLERSPRAGRRPILHFSPSEKAIADPLARVWIMERHAPVVYHLLLVIFSVLRWDSARVHPTLPSRQSLIVCCFYIGPVKVSQGSSLLIHKHRGLFALRALDISNRS